MVRSFPSASFTFISRQVLTGRYRLNRLAKIKAWIDENNPGDLLIPFSVALEDRLVSMPDDASRAKELEALGTTSALSKITSAGYASMNVRRHLESSMLFEQD